MHSHTPTHASRRLKLAISNLFAVPQAHAHTAQLGKVQVVVWNCWLLDLSFTYLRKLSQGRNTFLWPKCPFVANITGFFWFLLDEHGKKLARKNKAKSEKKTDIMRRHSERHVMIASLKLHKLTYFYTDTATNV